MTEFKFGKRQRTDNRAYTTRPSGTHMQSESKYSLEVFVTKEIVVEPTNEEGQNECSSGLVRVRSVTS